ncbi:glycosyltransferase [Chloroflexota bacterium]
MKLLIISHTPHYRRANNIVGWGPTVREIDYLAGLFDSVVHIAPCHSSGPPRSAMPYQMANIELHPVQPAGGDRLRDKFAILSAYPTYLQAFRERIKDCDMVHVRCPANISLLAIVYLVFKHRPRYRWIKYAGNWQPENRRPLSYTLQRRLLQRGLPGGVVSVNGSWPGQPPHIYSFENPALTGAELRRGRLAGQNKNLAPPYKFLFVGATNESKGVGRVIQIAHRLDQLGIPLELDLVGNGPERPDFENLARRLQIDGLTTFHGWLPRPDLAPFYQSAHFLLHPSASEGGPKVVSEAMAYGVVPLAGAVSSLPEVLNETKAGTAIPFDDIAAFVRVIRSYLDQPQKWQSASQAGLAAAGRFSYRHYLDSLQQMFADAWGLSLAPNGVVQDKYD